MTTPAVNIFSRFVGSQKRIFVFINKNEPVEFLMVQPT